MRRNTLGILAAGLLLIGIMLWFRGPEDGSAKPFASSCMRMGVVFLALWLALPQIHSLVGAARRWVFSWFTRKSDPRNKAQTSGSTSQPPRRPRRRSNA